MSMKSVLMISPYFVPRRRVGALRTFKFAIHLKDYGYNPVILTIKDDQRLASEAEKKLLSELDVIELSSPVDRTVQKKNRTDKEENSGRLTGNIADWIDRHTPSDTWIYFYLFHYFKVMRYAVSSKPDIVWATGDPWSSLVLGSLVARKLSVPFVCDFRDPWTRSGISLRDRSSFSRYWDKKLEENVLRLASKVVFTSGTAEKDYLENFNSLEGKTCVIYNAANDQIHSKREDSDDPVNSFKSGDLNITFFGTFRRLSPIEPAADILTKLRDQSPESFSKVKIHSFGEPDAEQLSYIRLQEVEEQFIFHQKVKPEQGARVLQQSDVLLLSTHPERGNIVPAKLWDYLITDVPILSIVPNPEVEEIIKEFQAGEHARPGELANAAGIISEWASKKTVEGAKSLRREPLSDAQKKKIGSRRKAEELAGIFDQITEHD